MYYLYKDILNIKKKIKITNFKHSLNIFLILLQKFYFAMIELYSIDSTYDFNQVCLILY